MAEINTNTPSRRPVETQFQNGTVQKNFGPGKSISVPNNIGYVGQGANVNFSTNFSVTTSPTRVPGTIFIDIAPNISFVGGIIRGMACVPAYPTSGKSIEIFYTVQTGYDEAVIQSYDRDSSSWKPLTINASSINFSANGVSVLTITSGSFLVNELLQFNRKSYHNYYNAGSTASINFANGGMQYCSVSANSTLALSGGVSGERASVVMKNTSGAAVTINLPTGITNSSGASSVTIQPNAAALFDIVCSGSVYFVNAMSYASGYVYP